MYSREWIKALQPSNGVALQGILGAREGVLIHDRSFPSNGPGVKAKCVCGKCNNGWMNVLDRQAQPIMLPLLSSFEEVSLSLEDQRILTTWAAKITMVLDYVGPIAHRVLTAAARRRMYEDRLPPDGAVIFLAGAQTTDPFLNDLVGSVSREQARRTALPRALLLAVRIKHLMFHIFAPEYGRWTSNLSALHGSLIQIWPLTFQVATWPPRRILESEFELIESSKEAWRPLYRGPVPSLS
jgi:hypothetical protein